MSNSNRTRYGQPFIFEDRTGLLTGSEFVDMHGRMSVGIRCTTSRDALASGRIAYMIYDTTRRGSSSQLSSSLTGYDSSGSDSSYYGSVLAQSRALAALDYGPENALGTVNFAAPAGKTCAAVLSIPMRKYLVKCTGATRTAIPTRKFLGSDGVEYYWSWRPRLGDEWACTTATGRPIASYSLKVPGEPEYTSSSGCVFTVEEEYPHLIVEMLASLMIMRHIAAHLHR